MTDHRIEIDHDPVPASRPRVTARGVAYYPKKHQAYKKFLIDALKDMDGFPVDTPVEVRVLSISAPYKTSDHPVYRADVDNLAKLPIDCMTSSEKYWDDDDMIVDLMTMKRFAREGEHPQTKIRIIPVEGDIGEHVDRKFEQ